MTARLRAPGLSRAFLFLVLGTMFCAAIIVVFREGTTSALDAGREHVLPIAVGVITLARSSG